MHGFSTTMLRACCALVGLSFFACVLEARAASPPERWLKGNTHAHTVLCGHGDSSPEDVARWYHDRGYNFLVLSEHNRYINPADVRLPPHARRDFVLIPGQEITQPGGFGSRVVHVTAFGTRGLVDWTVPRQAPEATIRTYIERVGGLGGIPILNHPNLSWSLSAADILPARALAFFEVYNAHPHGANAGDVQHPSTDVLWDRLLTGGLRLYGVAADDAHLFRPSSDRFTPGRAWIMVRTRAVNESAIRAALLRGDFYASTGVTLATLQTSPGSYTVGVDVARTEADIRSGLVGEPSAAVTPTIRIDFIGQSGRILRAIQGTRANLFVGRNEAYVRAKVTVVRRVRVGHNEYALREYYAWGQPVFGTPRQALD